MPRIRATRDARPNLLLTIFAAAAFMTALDVFIVNVGLRDLGHDVGVASLGDLSWILNAYTIVFAALLVPAGRLGDRYGNKAAFMVGLALFALASLGCALSSNLWLIVGLRCLQAVGGAALVPTSLGLILTTIPAERRQFSVRIWAITGSLGAAAGPALGGLLVALSWRWIFVINVPIGLLAMVLTARYVPDVRHDHETRIPDLLGGALLIAAVGTIALALVQGPGWGWSSAATIGCFAVAILATGLFILRSAHSKAPVVDLDLFKDRVFARANGAMFFANLAFGLQLLGLILWMQEGWGWSALQTGLAIAPGPMMVSITAIGLRARLAKVPEGVAAAVGVLLMGAGGVLIGVSIGAHADYVPDVLPGWLIVGAGVGLSLPGITAAGTANLAPHQTSTGSAVIQMGRWIGSTIGVALLVIVLGTSTGVGASVDNFRDAWLWAALPAVLGAAMALGITPPAAVTVRPPAPAAGH
jgi:EmrB/QacA subfamily drug resistance transporter